MTRDEAQKLVELMWPAQADRLGFACPAPMTPALFIKISEKLGILKLEEPITAEQKLWDALAGVPLHKRSDVVLRDRIYAAGLRIVEK